MLVFLTLITLLGFLFCSIGIWLIIQEVIILRADVEILKKSNAKDIADYLYKKGVTSIDFSKFDAKDFFNENNA